MQKILLMRHSSDWNKRHTKHSKYLLSFYDKKQIIFGDTAHVHFSIGKLPLARLHWRSS